MVDSDSCMICGMEFTKPGKLSDHIYNEHYDHTTFTPGMTGIDTVTVIDDIPKSEPNWEKLLKDLSVVLNSNSVDNWLNIPDYELAQSIVDDFISDDDSIDDHDDGFNKLNHRLNIAEMCLLQGKSYREYSEMVLGEAGVQWVYGLDPSKVIKAWQDGWYIQIRAINDGMWLDHVAHHFDFTGNFEYRVLEKK